MENKTVSITVKCLDSSNYTFQVSPELTVKQFKEHIEGEVKIAADAQRMIYCGRVLKDDQKLEQHDLDGKAIHLVAKPPPAAAGTEGGRDSPPPHHIHHHGGPNMRHTAFRLGGPPPVSLPSSSQMRASTAQRMFNGARATLQRIGVRDDDDANPLDFSLSDLGNRFGETIAHSVEVEIPVGNVNSPDTQAAVSAALAAVAQSMGIPGMQGGMGPFIGVRGGQNDGSGMHNFGFHGMNLPPGIHVEILPQVDINIQGRNEGGEEQRPNGAENPTGPSEQPRREGSEPPAAGPEGMVPPLPLGRSRQPRVAVMADLIEDLQAIQESLRPHMDRVRSLLRNDPTFTSQEEELEAQHIFRRVSETFHWLAHGYHALSDLMVDFRRPPPRNLYGTPYLVQSMAVLQGVIPIQAEIQIRANINNQQAGAPTPGAPTAPTSETPSGESENTTPGRNEDTPPPPTGQQNFGFRIPFGPQHFASMFGGQMGAGQGPRRPLNPAQRPTMPTNLANLVGSLFRGVVPGNQGQQPAAPPARNPTPTRTPAPPSQHTHTHSSIPQMQGLRPVPPPMPISNISPGNGFDEFLPCSSHHLGARNRRSQTSTTQTPRSASNSEEPMDFDTDVVLNGGPIPVQPWHSRVPQPWISVISRDVTGLDAIYSRRPSFSNEYIEEMPPRLRERFQNLGNDTPGSSQEGSSTTGQDVMDIDSQTTQDIPAPARTADKTLDTLDSDEDL